MVYHELQSAGAEAAHVATHSLHPSMAGTNIFGGGDDTLKDLVAGGLDGVADGLTPGDVVSSLFAQIGCAMPLLREDDVRVRDLVQRHQNVLPTLVSSEAAAALVGLVLGVVNQDPLGARVRG